MRLRKIRSCWIIETDAAIVGPFKNKPAAEKSLEKLRGDPELIKALGLDKEPEE